MRHRPWHRVGLKNISPVRRPYAAASSFATSAATQAATSDEERRRQPQIPLALYILRRLRQHGCSAMHGVPGDFTLPFLSYLQDADMKWVGSCNELNAAYAADGYARVTGLGAVCTTYGVGELSAINGIAGSYAERVPVVHIVGSPRSTLNEYWDAGGSGSFKGLIHHALGRGVNMEVYSKMARHVTADVVRLGNVRPEELENRIDRAIGRCLTEKRPVYIDVPSDFAALPVQAMEDTGSSWYEKPRSELDSSEEGRAALCTRLVDKLLGAKRPLIMVDGLAARFGLNKQLNQLTQLGIPTVVTTHGLGIIDSKHPSYYGVYTGRLGDAQLKDYVDNSDLVMLFGELFSDTATVGWDAIPKQAVTTAFTDYKVTEPEHSYSVNVATLLNELLAGHANKIRKSFASKQFAERFSLRAQQTSGSPARDTGDKISQDYLWPRLSSYFRPNDTILLANGTPLIGGAMFTLPSPVRVIASGIWFSIGQMLPAAQGAALGQANLTEQDRGRTILLEGDGSFQVTAQELSTIIRNRLDMTIILVNNRGYAYERLILGPEADYNAVADWQYTLAPAMMGAQAAANDYPIVSEKVETVTELEELLKSERMLTPNGLKFVEVVMDEKDVPSYFIPALAQSGKKLIGGDANGEEPRTFQGTRPSPWKVAKASQASDPDEEEKQRTRDVVKKEKKQRKKDEGSGEESQR